MFQAFCILEDNNKSTYKFGSYKIVPKKWMIAYLLDWAHKSIKSHLKTREIGEYLSNKQTCFDRKCMKNVNAFVRIESHTKCLQRLRKEKES